MVDLLYSPIPPPLVEMPATDGAISTTVDQLPVSGVDSSMKWPEMIDCGWVSVSGAFDGALAAAFLDSAVTMTVRQFGAFRAVAGGGGLVAVLGKGGVARRGSQKQRGGQKKEAGIAGADSHVKTPKVKPY